MKTDVTYEIFWTVNHRDFAVIASGKTLGETLSKLDTIRQSPSWKQAELDGTIQPVTINWHKPYKVSDKYLKAYGQKLLAVTHTGKIGARKSNLVIRRTVTLAKGS